MGVREKDEFIDRIKQLKSCGLTVTRSLATVGEIVQKPSVTLPFFGVTPAEKSVTEPLLSQLKNKNVTITPLQSVTIQKMNETVTPVTPVTPMPNVTSTIPVQSFPEKENNNNFTKGIQHSLRNKKEFNYGNYKCGICQKSLQSTEQLKLHIDVVHLGIQNTQFHRCDQCPQKFKMKSQLNKHVIMDHCDEKK